MSYFSGLRRGRQRPRLAPELDDAELGRVLKLFREPPRPGMMGITDLQVSRVAALMAAAHGDWDRRSHRLTVLAAHAPGLDLPTAWTAREPGNPDAHLFHARVRLEQALLAKSDQDVPALMTACRRAAELAPDDPEPWVISLGVAAVARHDRQTALKTWREALARYPASREAHFLMLAYLSPAAGGSRMHVIEFLDAIRARTPSEAPSAAVELAAIVEQHIGAVSRGGVEALMARDHWAQPPVRLILDRALAFWLTPGFLKHAAALADLNILAFALVGAERYDDAGRVFRALGGTVTPWPWRSEGDPVSVFERRQDRCLR